MARRESRWCVCSVVVWMMNECVVSAACSFCRVGKLRSSYEGNRVKIFYFFLNPFNSAVVRSFQIIQQFLFPNTQFRQWSFVMN